MNRIADELSLGNLTRTDWTVGAIVAVIAAFIGGLPLLAKALLALMVLDYVSGLTAAAVTGKIDSNIGWRGVGKKGLVWIVVGTTWIVQLAIGRPAPIVDVVLGFYCGIEAVSTVENAARAGVPIPRVVRDALARLAPAADGDPGPPRVKPT